MMSTKRFQAKLHSQTMRNHNINKAYNNFFKKLNEVVNNINIRPLKTARIKNTSNQWFDKKIAENLSIRDQAVSTQIRKSTKRQDMTSKEQSKRRKNSTLRRNCHKIQLSQKDKKNSSSNIYLKNKNGLLFDSLSIAETFKKYYYSLA